MVTDFGLRADMNAVPDGGVIADLDAFFDQGGGMDFN
jgi:hypothetical protein